MKKLGLLLIACMIVIGMSGCAKIVSETYEIIPAVVTEAEYTPARQQILPINKQIQVHRYPESGHITFVCKGREETFWGVSYYDRFHDKIGCNVWALSRVRVYDNDKVKEKIIDVAETEEQAENILRAWTEAEQ